MPDRLCILTTIFLGNNTNADFMKKILFLLLFATCITSFGQIRIKDDDGNEYNAFGGIDNIAEELLLYRDIYGHYPKDKKVLLDFVLDETRYDSTDSLLYLNQISIRNKSLKKLLKTRKNRLIVSNDTCSFYIAKNKITILCVGGIDRLQKTDSHMFMIWTFSRFYDKNGNLLQSLGSKSPFIPLDIRRRFSYVITMRSDESDVVNHRWSTPPVYIPITMDKNGTLSYDLSCLEGIQLFYQEYGKPFYPENTIGPISAEDAIDSEYLDLIRTYLNEFLDKHEEVDHMRLWEPVLFNNPPKQL